MVNKPGEWYPEHILSWYPHRDNKTVYFVFYEDMKKVSRTSKELKCYCRVFQKCQIILHFLKQIVKDNLPQRNFCKT